MIFRKSSPIGKIIASCLFLAAISTQTFGFVDNGKWIQNATDIMNEITNEIMNDDQADNCQDFAIDKIHEAGGQFLLDLEECSRKTREFIVTLSQSTRRHRKVFVEYEAREYERKCFNEQENILHQTVIQAKRDFQAGRHPDHVYFIDIKRTN